MQGLYRTTVKVPLTSFAINERYGVDSDNTAISYTSDSIGGMYKYIVALSDTLSKETDPANSGNYLIGLHDPIDNSAFGLTESPAFECYWPGAE